VPGGKVETSRKGWTVSESSESASSTERRRTSPATFYRQVVAELRKVVWPTQQQLITYFWVVLVFVIVVMSFVSLLDLGFGKLAFEIFA
jgi:preprotein translocase subunit SecE